MSKTMIEKLSEQYALDMKQGNGGHAVGFYSEVEERIKSEYSFEHGIFTLRIKEERFFWWDYEPLPKKD